MTETMIPNVAVPVSLLSAPESFGGRAQGGCLQGDLIVRAGRAVALRPSDANNRPRMVLPNLAEAHVHLDKCHTVQRLDAVGGDLHAAIEEQRRDKANWTAEDIRARAARGLDELAAAGCGQVRSHIDWSHGEETATPPMAWDVLCELAQDSAVQLQLAPLTGVADLAMPGMADAVAGLVAKQGGALGCFVFEQGERRTGIRAAFAAAERFGIPLDFHVDEGLAEGLDGLSVIAQTALEMQFEGPVLCGHACSLMNLSGDALARSVDLVARAGVSVAALPATNLYLQGRRQGTPDRRGITRLKELRDAGVNIVIGTDNVRDAFCPVGRHDPLTSLSLAVLGAHLDPPLEDHLPLITTNAACAMGVEPTYVDGARLQDLILYDAPTVSDLLAGTTLPTPLETHLEGVPA